MINKSTNDTGMGLDASPVNASSKQSITRSPNFLKLVLHNVQGISTTIKQQQLLTFLELQNIDIGGLHKMRDWDWD
jgi:hypothetical protein